jgi:hypothetical protein
MSIIGSPGCQPGLESVSTYAMMMTTEARQHRTSREREIERGRGAGDLLR